MGTTVQGALERAMRFPVQMPVHYRLPQTGKWFEALTENASRTGLLFRVEGDFEPATIVDVRLEVPPTRRNGESAEVVCKCKVIRTEAVRGDKSTAMAVAIHRYRFRRKRLPN
jgi:PilZ domain